MAFRTRLGLILGVAMLVALSGSLTARQQPPQRPRPARPDFDVRAQRWHEAERALRSSLENKDDAAHSDEARYQLARALRTLGRQREAISMLMELSEGAATREVTDDATLLLAQAQKRLLPVRVIR